MGNDGMDGGPKKPRGTGEPAGFRRKVPTLEQMQPPETVPANPFAQIAKDIKTSLRGMDVDKEQVQEEKDALVGASTHEIEMRLRQFKENGIDDTPEIALAYAEEYEERMAQGEREQPEQGF